MKYRDLKEVAVTYLDVYLNAEAAAKYLNKYYGLNINLDEGEDKLQRVIYELGDESPFTYYPALGDEYSIRKLSFTPVNRIDDDTLDDLKVYYIGINGDDLIVKLTY